jgi:hypothetical protein
MPTAVVRIYPMLATDNMDESLGFFQSVLGFTPIIKSPDYSVIARDGQPFLCSVPPANRS